MWPYMKFIVVSDSWILYHYLLLVNFPSSYMILTRFRKKTFSKIGFSKELSLLRNTTCIVRQHLHCAATSALRNSISFLTSLPLYWLMISDSQSGIKFMTSTSVKFLIRNFISDTWSVPTDNKGKTWHIHDFLEAADDNIKESFLVNAAAIACFWYFNNYTFSVLTPLAFDNYNVFLVQIFRLHTWVLFAIFFLYV